MLNSLITSKTRIRLLLKFFLNPDTQAYLQELATEFGESSNGIRIELNRLAGAKLLRSETSGRTILYRANTEHSMYQDIRNVVIKYVGIDKLIEDLIQKIGQVNGAWITGDYARGIDSGLIDLVVVGDVNMGALQRTIDKTGRLIHRKIRSIVLDEKEFELLRSSLDIEHALPIWKSTNSNSTE